MRGAERENSTKPTVEGHRYGVPAVVEENIQKQATRVASRAGCPDIAEDLEQEARVRAWQEAEEGETNPQYLLADTKQEISGVARGGRDVDGRLWGSYEREHVWCVLSTDYPMDERGTTFGEILLDEKASVEEQAVTLVIASEIAEGLTEEEREIFEQCLEDYYQREIAENTQVKDRYVVRRRMRRIQEKVAGYFGRAGSCDGSG